MEMSLFSTSVAVKLTPNLLTSRVIISSAVVSGSIPVSIFRIQSSTFAFSCSFFFPLGPAKLFSKIFEQGLPSFNVLSFENPQFQISSVDSLVSRLSAVCIALPLRCESLRRPCSNWRRDLPLWRD